MLVFRSRAPVVGVGIDRDATTGREQANDLNILGIHQAHQILHDRVHTVFVEVAMVTEREEVEFQALRLHHPLARDIENLDLRKVGLSCDGTERRKLWTVELHPVVVIRMLVHECLQHLWGIVHAILSLLAKGL